MNKCFLCLKETEYKCCTHCECYSHYNCWKDYVDSIPSRSYLIRCPSCRRNIPRENITFEQLEQIYMEKMENLTEYMSDLEDQLILSQTTNNLIQLENEFYDKCITEMHIEKNKILERNIVLQKQVNNYKTILINSTKNIFELTQKIIEFEHMIKNICEI